VHNITPLTSTNINQSVHLSIYFSLSSLKAQDSKGCLIVDFGGVNAKITLFLTGTIVKF